MLYSHEEKKELFKRLAEQESLGQAYLFFGESKIGKFLFAKHLAFFLEYGEFNILKKPLVDTIIVETSSETLGLDDLDEVNKFISQRPFKSSKRLIIIRDAEKLTEHAASSLLKQVEESSDHTSFIFIANDPQTILPPLVSRLMKVYFSKLSSQEIDKILVSDFDLNKSEAKKVSMQSFGCIGEALDIIEDKKEEIEEEESIYDYISEKIKSLYIKDKFKNSKVISRLLKREEKIKQFNLNPKVQKKAIEFELKK